MAALNNTPFPPELRTLSVVPRWSIVHTTQVDTVSNHSFFVTFYAHMIGRVIKWEGSRTYLLYAALLHDCEEAILGDLVSPIKKQIIDQEKADEYVNMKMQERMNGIVMEFADLTKDSSMRMLDEADLIIKAADRLDALLFLIMESRRGNKVIDPLIKTSTALLEAAWRDLPVEDDVINMTWQTTVLPSLELHRTHGGQGL